MVVERLELQVEPGREQVAVHLAAPAGPLAARLYTPTALRKTDGLSPCLVFFHGGGLVIGDLDTHEAGTGIPAIDPRANGGFFAGP